MMLKPYVRSPPAIQPLAVAVPLFPNTTENGVSAKLIFSVATNSTNSSGESVPDGLAKYSEMSNCARPELAKVTKVAIAREAEIFMIVLYRFCFPLISEPHNAEQWVFAYSKSQLLKTNQSSCSESVGRLACCASQHWTMALR